MLVILDTFGQKGRLIEYALYTAESMDRVIINSLGMDDPLQD